MQDPAPKVGTAEFEAMAAEHVEELRRTTRYGLLSLLVALLASGVIILLIRGSEQFLGIQWQREPLASVGRCLIFAPCFISIIWESIRFRLSIRRWTTKLGDLAKRTNASS